jgi:ATP-dependent RNA helicase RhlE
MDFKTLGLTEGLVEKLTQAGISTPTPIQERAIPAGLQGRDVMGLAQTGTGKTIAFGMPLLQQLNQMSQKPEPKTARALILAPTRELAKQIADNLGMFTRNGHIRTTLVVGGASINPQISKLSRGTDILVATPGRLMDLMDRRAVKLHATQFLVLDEADQMLDLGFIVALRKIATHLPAERQTMLFSATMPKQMNELANTYLTKPVRVEVSRSGQTAAKVTQNVHYVAQGDKERLLKKYLAEHMNELALVFSRTKHGAERLMKNLVKDGFEASSIHGNKSQGQRERAITGFREGKIKVLVATDVAARGIDIPDVRHVYNYDLPNVPENYVHRIGRTARAGAGGRAIAFCAAGEMSELKAIQKVIKLDLPVLGGSPWHGEHAEHEKPKRPQRRRNSRRPAGRSRQAA